jgi:hypothetical protein
MNRAEAQAGRGGHRDLEDAPRDDPAGEERPGDGDGGEQRGASADAPARNSSDDPDNSSRES